MGFRVLRTQADEAGCGMVGPQADDEPKKRTFRKFTFRGVDLEQLLDLPTDKLVELFHARARRRFQRGLKRKPLALIKKLRKAVRASPSPTSGD
jgi:small subunit ribosomal protein S15e